MEAGEASLVLLCEQSSIHDKPVVPRGARLLIILIGSSTNVTQARPTVTRGPVDTTSHPGWSTLRLNKYYVNSLGIPHTCTIYLVPWYLVPWYVFSGHHG